VSKEIAQSNTLQKVNHEQDLLNILKENTQYIDEDKTSLLSLVPGLKNWMINRSTGQKQEFWLPCEQQNV